MASEISPGDTSHFKQIGSGAEQNAGPKRTICQLRGSVVPQLTQCRHWVSSGALHWGQNPRL